MRAAKGGFQPVLSSLNRSRTEVEKRLQTSALLGRVLSLTLLRRSIERRLGDLSERTTSESEGDSLLKNSWVLSSTF